MRKPKLEREIYSSGDEACKISVIFSPKATVNNLHKILLQLSHYINNNNNQEHLCNFDYTKNIYYSEIVPRRLRESTKAEATKHPHARKERNEIRLRISIRPISITHLSRASRGRDASFQLSHLSRAGFVPPEYCPALPVKSSTLPRFA